MMNDDGLHTLLYDLDIKASMLKFNSDDIMPIHDVLKIDISFGPSH